MAKNRRRPLTAEDLLGRPGLRGTTVEALLAIQPRTVAQALRIRYVGRKTARRLHEMGLLTDPEGALRGWMGETRPPADPLATLQSEKSRPDLPGRVSYARGRFAGRWRIVGMERWDADARDLGGPAFIEFARDGTGEFRFVAVEASIDCRYGERDWLPLVEFSWHGWDDGTETSGRGWAVVGRDDVLRGRILIHRGDDSAFEAVRVK